MLPLLFCQGLFGVIVAIGPGVDNANRVAGLASVSVSIIVSSSVAVTSTRRELKLGILAVITTALAVLALPYCDGQVLRNPGALSGAFLMAASDENRLLSPHIVGLTMGAPTLFLTSLAFHKAHPIWLRLVWTLGAATGMALIGLTDSRDAAIATASGLLVLVFSLVFKHRGVVALFCGLAIAAAGLVTLFIFGEDPSLRQREQLWGIALRALVDSPLLGLGYGRLGAMYRAEFPAIITNAHNLIVQTAADFGGIGVMALALAVVSSLRAAVVETVVSPAMFRGFMASLTFVVVAGMAESVVDMAQRFAAADVTIVVPLMFAVLAVPLGCRTCSSDLIPMPVRFGQNARGSR